VLEPLLYQYLGISAVPWQAALEGVCHRLESSGVDWWLCGSAALAVRGVAVIPRDLDLAASRPPRTNRRSPTTALPQRTACRRSAGTTGRSASPRCTSSVPLRHGAAWLAASP